MNRLFMTAAAALIAASSASAQNVLIPIPGFGGGRPSQAGQLPNDPWSQLFGPNAGARAGAGTPLQGRGAFGSTQPGSMGVNGTDNNTDINNANITGHPTRFMAYNQYFLNSGASLPQTASGQLGGQSLRLIGGINPLQSQPGQRPLRGRANTPGPNR